MALVEFEIRLNNIGVIKLNDPEQLNAMTPEMAVEFKELVKTLKAERPVRVLIITGTGRAFSAGGSLEMLKEKISIAQLRNREIMLDFYASFLGILDLKIPLIAAINGHAVGAGMCLAAACDFRIAVSGAKLGFNFLKLGLHPGMGASVFLPRIVGYTKALELMTTARVISADEASTLGLVNKLVQDTAVLAQESISLAEELLQVGPVSLGNLLETLRVPAEELQKGLLREAHCQSVSYTLPEFKEGIQAAIEKRPANF